MSDLENAWQKLQSQVSYVRAATEDEPDVVSVMALPSQTLIYSSSEGFMNGDRKEDLFIHPDDHVLVKAYYESFTAAVPDDEIHTVYYRVRNNEGEYMTLFLRGKIFDRHEDGSVRSVLNIIQNFSEQKKAQQKLRESEELMLSILGNTSSSIMVLEPMRDFHNKVVDFKYTFVNEWAMKSVSRHDLTDKYFLDEFPLVKNSELFRYYVNVMETGNDFQQEVDMAPYGTPVWSQVYARRMGDKLLVTYFDITDRKKTEQQILNLKDQVAQKATDRYYSVFNSIDEGFCIYELIYNDDNKVTDLLWIEVNPAYEKQTGLKNVVGKRHSELSLNTEKHWFEVFDQVVKTGRSVHFENWHESTGRWYRTFVSRIGPPQHNQVAVAFDDVTARKLLEQQQEFVLKLSDELHSLSDPVEIITAVTTSTMHYFNADRCYYCEIEGDEAIIRYDARKGSLPSVAATYPLSSFKLFKKIVDEKRPFIVYDARISDILDEPLRQLCNELQVISFVNIPVVKNGKVSGVLCLVQSSPRHWTERDVALVTETAERAWTAVERSKAEDAVLKSEHRQAFLLRLNDALRSLNGASDIQQTASRFIAEHLGVDRVVYAEIEGAGEGMEAVLRGQFVQHGALMWPERISYSALGQGFVAEPFSKGIPFVVNDAATDPRFDGDEDARAAWMAIGGRSVIYLSLLKNGKEQIIFGLHYSRPRVWTQAEINLMAEVAERTWAAAERARAEEVLQKSEEKFRTLFNSMDEGVVTLELFYDDKDRAVDFCYLEHNPAVIRQTGLNSDITGRWASELFPNMEPYWLQTYDRIIKTGESERHEYYFIKLDSWFDIYISRIGDMENHKVVCVYNNITHRKKAEERQAFLLNLNDALRAGSDPLLMQAMAANLLGEYLKVNHAYYAETNGEYVQINHSYVDGIVEPSGLFRQIDLGGRLLDSYCKGIVQVCYDTATDQAITPQERAKFVSSHIGAYISVPLLKSGKWVAILTVKNAQPRQWTAHEINLVHEVAERTCAAIERAKAERALGINETRMRIQKEAFQQVVNGASLTTSLHTISNLVVQETNGEARTAFYIIDADGTCLHPIIGAGNMDKHYLEEIDGFVIGEHSPACGLAVPTGEQVLTADVYTDPLWKPWAHLARKYDYRGCWSFPIKTKDNKAVGTFAMYFREPRETTASDLGLADVITQAAAVIISGNEESAQRERAEVALRYSEEKFRNLFDSMDEGYCIIEMIYDVDGNPVDWRYLEVNPAFEKHNGLVNAAGKTIRELTPGIEQKWMDIYGRVAKTGESIRFEEDSQSLHRIFDLFAFRVGLPEEQKVAVLFTDITARKQSEEALRTSQTHLAALVEALPTAIGMMNMDGKLILSNKEMQFFLPDNMMPSRNGDKNRWMSWYPDGKLLEPHNFPGARALRGESVVPGIEMQYTDEEGNKIWTMVSAVPLKNEVGEITGTVSAIIDITELKEAEQAIREFNTKLERLVEERTAQLQQTINQLESFNYIASHDLQEPLRRIRTYVELLKEYQLSDEQLNRYINSINDSSVRMSQLIESLLSYSRNTRVSEAFQPVDLNQVLKDVKTDHEIAIKEKQALIKNTALPVIQAIPFQITQVFSNLISNSLKFSDKPPVITVQSKTITGKEVPVKIPANLYGKWFIELTFKDNGIGFDNRYREKIFELFQRLHTPSAYAGTGIGLSIVHRIIQQHKGYITAESGDGNGATFKIYLPV